MEQIINIQSGFFFLHYGHTVTCSNYKTKLVRFIMTIIIGGCWYFDTVFQKKVVLGETYIVIDILQKVKL